MFKIIVGIDCIIRGLQVLMKYHLATESSNISRAHKMISV